ncbi:protein of unknown function DUF1877 [Paenibacillus curdlanolyticus YK9]|uniref:DUF1877 domain-containing protein n=1 Tax=Paenibacillus curdlanolyticus YK9 TaxID=717606 RepID=E0IGE8_9BACL|nr:YfbM family protein [Paenibacillus curdlanolyticus]EFM08448.1 protein of unknown function DUF1877 [Paenibacillus curdlanolyticus YK9]
MGMIGHLKQVSPELLNDLIEQKVDAFSILFEESDVNRTLYLDKSWHAIHFLLNGEAWEGEEPLVYAVFGGAAIGGEPNFEEGDEVEEDSPARYLTVEQVKQVSAALQQIPEEELARRFIPARMAELDIYPSTWEDEGELAYVMDYYRELAAYYQEAADNGQAMLLHIG